MGRRRLFTGVALATLATISWAVACTGSDPILLPSTGSDGSGDAVASDSSTGDARTEGDGADSSSTTDAPAGDACFGPLDTTPCGCPGASSCCSFTDGGSGCYPVGNGPPECISGPDAYIACVGRSSCPPDSLCCAIGTLSGDTCPRRLSHFDTACDPIDAGSGGPLCAGKTILCSKQSDCEELDAGRCEPAVMEILARTMGVCVK